MAKEIVHWNIPVPKSLDSQVEDAVKSGSHISKSEFVRDACRKLLLIEEGGTKP